MNSEFDTSFAFALMTRYATPNPESSPYIIPTFIGVSMSVKSPVPMINNTIGGDKRISPEDISLNKISILRNIKGITVPKKRLIISPIKNENTESSINGLDPAMNMLRTSLPSGSVPKRC